MSTLCKIFAFLLCFAVTVAHISFKNEENFDDIHFLTSSTDKQLPWSEGTLRSRLKKRSTTGGGDKPKLSVYSFSDANHNQAVLHWSGVPGSEVKLLLYTLICGTSVVKIRMQPYMCNHWRTCPVAPGQVRQSALDWLNHCENKCINYDSFQSKNFSLTVNALWFKRIDDLKLKSVFSSQSAFNPVVNIPNINYHIMISQP